MPAPTMEPTTSEDSEKSESFWAVLVMRPPIASRLPDGTKSTY
ncbi:hypothetical protein SAMCCGM7_Ch3105 [Sinorhizobium americanum CCGM7]|nr:hypothetical protein SAMCCGM7_Ch3105 [Sinorhizobium americanum CCGM7]